MPFDAFPGKMLDGKYVVESVIGEGTFGKVYKVMRQGYPLPLALKLLKLWKVPDNERNKLIDRFDQEFETGLIHSDYLVQSHDSGRLNGNPYIVMEYCPGGNLLEAVKQHNIDLVQALREVLLGLKALHDNGKVHRDLKPQNVLLKEDGRATLSDFGVAGDRNRRITARGLGGLPKEVFGTYAYMSPERVTGQRSEWSVLPSTDMYAFGVMAYQLLTGFLPFGPLADGEDLVRYVRRATNNEWDRMRLTYTPHLRRWIPLIESCLHPDPAKRLQTADEALGMLPDKEQGISNQSAINAPRQYKGYCLRVMQGEQYGRIYDLNLTARTFGRRVLTIGRNDTEVQNFIPLKERESSYVSRRHSTLELSDDGTWLLRDGQWDVTAPGHWQASRNGTYIGPRRVDTCGAPIRRGDIITIGDIKFRVETY